MRVGAQGWAAAALCSVLLAAPALAQDATPHDMHGMQHQQAVPPEHAAHAAPAQQVAEPDHAMHDMPMPDDTDSAQPRSPDYSEGLGYTAMTGMDMRDDAPLGMLLVDRLEAFNGRDDHGGAFDMQAWYGNDASKLWLKAEGETVSGRLHGLRVEALWDRPLDTFWDTQLGIRHDGGEGPARNWAAFGVQGLAPYWFEVSATLYLGTSGRSAFRFESEYELLLTQRLILQPRFEANVYGRGDPQRGIGAGLSDATLGLRLRYEFSRQFAPYAGVEFERRFGATARLARNVGEPAFEPRLVAGLRFWF